MLLVASETGHVYTFATRKLQPMITSEAGKALIQTCLNSPDPFPTGTGDQRMSATGFEETELSYNVADDEKVRQLIYGGASPHSHHLSSSNAAGHQQLSQHHHHHQHHSQQQQHTANPHVHSQHLHPHQHPIGSPHMINMGGHPHSTHSPPSHMIPCSSPSPMLGNNSSVFQQHPSCSSPISHSSVFAQHIPHSHPQR